MHKQPPTRRMIDTPLVSEYFIYPVSLGAILARRRPWHVACPSLLHFKSFASATSLKQFASTFIYKNKKKSSIIFILIVYTSL